MNRDERRNRPSHAAYEDHGAPERDDGRPFEERIRKIIDSQPERPTQDR